MLYPPTDWAARWARYAPDQPAVSDDRCTLTYRELHHRGGRLAHALAARGLRRGDRIAVLAENDCRYLLLFVAAQRAGFVLVPLNYRLSKREIAYILNDADPRLLIYQEDLAHLLPPAGESPQINLDEVGESSLNTAPPPGPDLPAPTEDDPIFILYTSGTTGFPKGALYTHRMLFWNSENTVLSLNIGRHSRTVNVMPPFHTGGWNVLTTPFLHRGGYTRLLRRFDPEAVLELLAAERATVFMAVPTMVRMLAESPAFATTDLSALEYLIVGGEPLPPALIECWHDRGVPVRQGYGMTEVGPNLFSLHQDDAMRKKGSIGRPNFYVDARVVDERGDDCPADTPGELWLRGPVTTPGYWRNPDATRRAFAGEWFRTGDIVRQDAEDYYYVVGRLKEMYISGGENVYPAEVERRLEEHPAVAAVAVVGVADDCWGEVGHAFVVAKPGTTPGTDELQRHCRDGLAKFKVPRHFTFVAELPRTTSGKIDRRALAPG